MNRRVCGRVSLFASAVVLLAFAPGSRLAAEPELIKAFAFGSRNLTCSVFNKPDENYTMVVQTSPAALEYNAGRGWGFEVTNPGDNSRGGYGRFGPFDDSPNNRTTFSPNTCPLELYDSFLGTKTYAIPCAPIDPLVIDPDEEGAVCDAPEGAIFRADVPNGLYRFVMAIGSPDNPHKHRILAQDGGEGPPDQLDPLNDSFVVLVNNYDQSKHGTGVYARVGFGCFIPPPAAVNGFINVDDEGLLLVDDLGQPTGEGANSPTLEVTEGYIRIHALKGFGTGDANGGDLVILELWKVEGNEEFPEPIFVDVDVVFDTPDPRGRNPGDDVAIILNASNVSVPTTITVTAPDGWAIDDPGDGQQNGNQLTFAVSNDGELTFGVRSPDDCLPGDFRVDIAPEGGCPTAIIATLECIPEPGDLNTASGGISAALILGPIDLGGNSGPQCDDNGRLPTTDYLASDDTGDETNVLVADGDELIPEFGVLAGGVGVAFAPNPDVNPFAIDGVLTVWTAVADSNGYINYNLPENLDSPLDDYIIYSLNYLENTTDECLPVMLELGSDDAIKARLNGRLIHVNQVCRGIPGYGSGDMVPATLVPGQNILLVAVVERGGGTGVRVVVRDTAGNPLVDGSVRGSLVPPDSYPEGAVPAEVTRTLASGVIQSGIDVEVALSAINVSAQATIVETFDALFSVKDAGGGSVQGNTITWTVSQDTDLQYTLEALETCPARDLDPFTGTVTIPMGCPEEAPVLGASSIRCVAGCPREDNGAALFAAFHFGSRLLDCPLASDDGENYITVLQVGGDPNSVKYSEDLGYGYEQLYFIDDPFDPDDNPDNLPAPVHSARGGWEIYGPFDDSPNNRNEFGDDCPDQIYDSFIGAKNWLAGQQSCSQFINDPPDGNVPCNEGNVAPIEADGIIFRIDVPNGTYRFVGAFGSADNTHATRILAENGGEGPPSNISEDHVVLVHNHDQAQYDFGETDGDAGDGVYARVGFDGLLPPLGDGVSPDPQFVNMDEEGRPTNACPSSPTLTVTEGYIRIHQLQANSNDGPGGGGDPNGGNAVILEIWEAASVPCDERDADTHCDGLQVTGPANNEPGTYVASATATDDSGDRVQYTFTADNGAGMVMTRGPQASSSASFDLVAGSWTISVSVDDDCPETAPDNTCSQTFTVGGGPRFIRGDVTADGALNITDAVRGLGIQFLGDAPVVDCLEIQDVNDDGAVNITDPIASLGFQFLGQAAPAAPFPTCGADPEGSRDLGCAEFPPCEP